MEELVSVIIPVYNTPIKFLDECLDSVKKQTFKNLEIIIIDDGSKKEIADYVDKCKGGNVYVFHKEQGGVSSARNYGIKHSNGKYLCFVDSDDVVNEKFIQYLYYGIKDKQVLISACCLEKEKEPELYKKNEEKVIFSIYEEEDIWKNINTGYCVTKMYNRCLFEKITFDENISMCEDALFLNKVLNETRKCSATNSALYYYRDNPVSTSRFANSKKYRQAIYVSNKIMELECVKDSENNIKLFKGFQAMWEFKYMLAVVYENGYEEVKSLKSEKQKYKTDVLPYTTKTSNKYVKIINIFMMMPYPFFIFFLKLGNVFLRKRRKIC